MSTFNSKKFRFAETFTNTNGKTSGSGFIGEILGLVAAISFLAAMVGYFLEIPNTIDVMDQMLKLITASALLLGVRKVAPMIGKKNGHDIDNGHHDNHDPYNEIDPNDEQIVDYSKKG